MQKLQKCHLKFDAVSAFSLVQRLQKRSLMCHERLLSTRVSNVARFPNFAHVSLKCAPVGGAVFQVPSISGFQSQIRYSMTMQDKH